MGTITALQLFMAAGEGMMQAAKYDEIDANTSYVGYCSPTCKGAHDAAWLIKRIKKEGTVQTISYANGSRLYNQIWDDRYGLTYKLTECEIDNAELIEITEETE